MEDGQPLERQVGVDRLEALDARYPRKPGQPASGDRMDVRRNDAVRLGKLRPQAIEQAARERLVAKNGSRLDRADRVSRDRAIGSPELDSRQLGRPGRE